MDLEAAQARDWAPWHAVRPGQDVTLCGHSVRAWQRSQRWDDHPENRCQVCVVRYARWQREAR